MKKNLIYLEVIFLAIGIISFASAAAFNNPSGSSDFSAVSETYQYTQPNFNSYYSNAEISTYWPMLRQMEQGNCTAGTDFIVSIPPGGCSPAVVRSDLLEEQNVPVFCQLSAIKVNPLIQVASIRSISFSGKKPEGVLDISFHPARAAIRSYTTLLGSPLLNNIGYVVIVLDRTKKEKNMTDFIFGNLTATIYYEVDKAYGTGNAQYYLPIISDDNWSSQFESYGFWNGKGFLRAEDIQGDNAKIALYLDKDKKFHEITLKEGQQSSELYFPFSYCKAGLQVKLDGIETEEQQARLNVDGDVLWVKQGSKLLNDRCSVRDINILYDKTGTIDISCPQKSIRLAFLPKGAAFSRDSAFDVKINNLVFGEWYLAYSGIVPAKFNDKKGKSFAVLARNSDKKINMPDLSKSISKRIYDLVNSDSTKIYGFDDLKNNIVSVVGESRAKVILEGEDVEPEVKFLGLSQQTSSNNFNQKGDAGKVISEYIQKSDKSLDPLIDEFKTTTGQNEQQSFGEEALIDSIRNAEYIGEHERAQIFGQKFLTLYPNSKFSFNVRLILNNANNFDLSQSNDRVFVNNEYHYIYLEELKPLEKESKKARIVISGIKEADASEGDTIYLTGDNTEKAKAQNDYIYIQKIDSGTITLIYHDIEPAKPANPTVETTYSEKLAMTKTLKENEPQLIFGRQFEAKNIELRRVAKVSLIPHIDSTKSKADFTFKVGIEKRDIKLSDEKTKEMIENLNKTINRWNEITSKLGNLIKSWKGVCFATSLVLMAKSTIQGFTGQAIARQRVMETYKTHCAAMHKDMSRTQCYNGHDKEIDSGVDSLTKSIGDANKQITSWQSSACQISKGTLFSGAVVNDDCVKERMREVIRVKYGDSYKVNVNGKDILVPINSITDYETLRMMMAEDKVVSDPVLSSQISTDVKRKLTPLAQIVKEEQDRKNNAETLKKNLGTRVAPVLMAVDSTDRKTAIYGRQKLSDFPGLKEKIQEKCNGCSIDDNTPIQFDNTGTNIILLPMGVSSGTMPVTKDNIYKITQSNNGFNIEKQTDESEIGRLQQYNLISGGECSNQYSNPKLKYYDTGNFKGMPAIVPFDLAHGWYAKVSQTPGGIFSTEQAGYKQSGQVSFFYLCNVGDDGAEQNGKWPDDICMSIDVNNYAKYTEFAGCPAMRGVAFQKLIEDAQEAIRQAAKGYGNNKVRIFNYEIETGLPVDGNNLAECQDFMSPDECKILFNVCDPVICPASRCNFGGAYPVSNVIQTGIIGSIFLCLPNIKEGVVVPICLSGIHAGLESFVSILESERKCLQTSLDTGEHVGICDEITSVYLCEFFWRQLAPVMNILIPKMIEMAYGQGTRGGGEYLSVKSSWDNLQNNIDYFKNTYAQNAFRAFEFRNVEEAGGTFCKAFVGTSLPTSGSILDNLLEPESPEQIYAWFSEIPYSEATVPSTSQYKVYFHIFAGNDMGAQYRVYLKNPPSSSYYQNNAIINVKTGYIAKGDSADESIDFTSPSGYKELCVELNAQTHCGFKSVTTDFALDYLNKKYIEDQATTAGITKEKDCISGTKSLWAAATSPNLQTGAEQAVQPTANLKGIVRVCSTENPGNSAEVTSANPAKESTLERYASAGGQVSGDQKKEVDFKKRWQLVGYCDNPNIGCWLDTKSVKTDVQTIQAIEGTSLEDIEKKVSELNVNTASTQSTEATTIDALSQVENDLSNEEFIDSLKAGLTKDSTRPGIIANIQGKINGAENKLGNLTGDPRAGGIYPTSPSLAYTAKALLMQVKLYNAVVKVLYDVYFRESPTSEKESEIIFQCNGESSTYVVYKDSKGVLTYEFNGGSLNENDFGTMIQESCEGGSYKKFEEAIGISSKETDIKAGITDVRFLDSNEVDINYKLDNPFYGTYATDSSIFVKIIQSGCMRIRLEIFYSPFKTERFDRIGFLSYYDSSVDIQAFLRTQNKPGKIPGKYYVNAICYGKDGNTILDSLKTGEMNYWDSVGYGIAE